MAELGSELDAALKAMEASFHVRLIGTFPPDLVCAVADADAARWLKESNVDFDQFPVKAGDETVGVLLRDCDHAGRTVREAMEPLREGLIVSADMPIADLIPQLCENHYRLVLRGGRIDGLVTQSDLLKLPVRMLLFGMISHLELCFRALVRARAPWPKWLELLDTEPRRAVNGRLRALQDARLNSDPLEATNFSDVASVLAHESDLGESFKLETEAIRILRNDVAHSKTYLSSLVELPQFVDRFTYIRRWIDHVSRLLKPA